VALLVKDAQLEETRRLDGYAHMCGLFKLHFIQLLSYLLNCDYLNSCGRRRRKTAGFDCVATGVTLYLCYSVHIDDFLLQKAAARTRASLQGESGSRTRAGCLQRSIGRSFSSLPGLA